MFNSVQDSRALLGSICTYVVLPRIKPSRPETLLLIRLINHALSASITVSCIIHDMSSIGDLYERSPSTGSEPETESTTDFPSTSESSYNPSETSGDRDFVVSDAETLSPRSSFSDYSAENDVSDGADDLSIESVSVCSVPYDTASTAPR